MIFPQPTHPSAAQATDRDDAASGGSMSAAATAAASVPHQHNGSISHAEHCDHM